MGIFRDYRDAVLAHIRTNMPEFHEVDASPGMFTEEMVRRYAMKAPACRVANLGLRRIERLSTGEQRGPVRMAAYVIAEDEPPVQSFDVAMDLGEKLAGLLDGSNLGYARAGAAELQEIENLFSMPGERRGVSIVAVSWVQLLRFGVNTYDLDTAGEMVLGSVPAGQYQIVSHGMGEVLELNEDAT